MKKILFILSVICLVPSCAPIPVAPPDDLEPLLSGASFEIEGLPIPSTNVLIADSAMKSWVHEQTRSTTSARSRLRSIVNGMVDDGLLSLEYDENRTLTPAETFHLRSGNCLSFSMLFVTLAREAGLDVTFQMVRVPPTFTASGDLVMLNNHINVLVRRVRADTQFYRNHVVDFNTVEFDGNYDTKRVSDDYAIALYHSNLAVEHIEQQNFPTAFLHLRLAIQSDPEIPGIWTNLGALYSKSGNRQFAIKAYQQALSLEPSYKSALVNMAAALAAEGRASEAAEYRQRARYYQNLNPYYHYQIALDHYNTGHYQDSLTQLSEAIKLKTDEHQFYRLSGFAYLQLGHQEAAIDSFKMARKEADNGSVYSEKLKLLGVVD